MDANWVKFVIGRRKFVASLKFHAETKRKQEISHFFWHNLTCERTSVVFRSFLYLCRCSHCPQAFRYNNNVWTLFQWCFCKNDYWQDIVVAVWYSFCPLQLPEKIFFIPLFNTYLSICYLYFFASKVQYAQNIFTKSDLILLIIFVLISC